MYPTSTEHKSYVHAFQMSFIKQITRK